VNVYDISYNYGMLRRISEGFDVEVGSG